MGSIYWILNIIYSMWWLSGFVIYLHKRYDLDQESKKLKVCRWLYLEIKPFVPTIIVLAALFCPYGVVYNFLDMMLNVWLYFVYRDIDKDDRWKKRLEKAKSKVQVSESRLVVVPESA